MTQNANSQVALYYWLSEGSVNGGENITLFVWFID